ncbi:MAG: hypothetical protein IPI81_17320 [Flavobacteriales bacterium]|nr:hypothetical protein [Flavobacteriales bacterium]
MRRPVLFAVLIGSATSACAQLGYGNEWIDHGRQYWKFEVYADGVYRIDSAALAQAGFPVTSVDPRHLMLFGKEQQVPVYVQGEADGEFNSGDFIEFRAEKADGMVDRRMYPFPDADPNPDYSLYNDTVRYFLTWDEQAPAMHMVSYSNNEVAAGTPRPWVWSETTRVYSDNYLVGFIDTWLGGQGIPGTPALMLEAEGFAGPMVFNTAPAAEQFMDVTVLTPEAFIGLGVPLARVKTTSIGMGVTGVVSQADHHLRLYAGPGLAQVMVDTAFNGARTMRGTFDMPGDWVGPTTTVRFGVPHDLPLANWSPQYLDWQAVNNVHIRYARTLNMGGISALMMEVPNDGTGPIVRLDLSGVAGTPVVYAWGDTVRRMEPFFGTAWHALFPRAPGIADTRAFAFTQESIQPITTLRMATPTGYFTDFGALDIDSAMLIVTHHTLMNGATAYGNYRQNESPNHYNTLVIDVDELYDQYGAGVPKNAGAIRSFCDHLLDAWSTDPRALFLVGKAVNTWSGFASGAPSVRPDVNGAYARTLVPTFGNPSSDQCFTTGLNFDARRMDIPVGRISANTNADVLAYLAKVRATEAQPPALWQKNILHFSGGFHQDDQAWLAQLLANLGQIASDTAFGGNVIPFRRNTSGVIGAAPADSVRHFIEDEGVTLMTFLAHAYAASFDITIDEPENYNWHGKHPMVIGNSCYIGNVHLNGSQSASEQWVLQPEVGPIAFLAATEQGFTNYLLPYTGNFYESFARTNYGASIGEHYKSAGLMSQMQTPTIPMMWNVHNFHLEGDPTLTLNTHPLPDFSVRTEEVFFDPPNVTADLDSFTVAVVVSNLGKATNDVVNVELQRTNTGLGTNTFNFFTTVDSVYIRDTAYFRVPTLAFSGGQGVNQFTVKVDREPDLIPELVEVTNNITSATLFITSGDLVPVYPYDFAIVPDPEQALKASTGDPLAPMRTYVFQIDTADSYNSPVMESFTTTAPGGVVTWEPQGIFNLNTLQDSTVFYWRCSIDSASSGNNSYNWYERSFQYIANKRGWGQAHFFQFKNDRYSGVNWDRPGRDFDFEEGSRLLRATVQGNVGGPITSWYLDLQAQDYGGCGPAAWHVVVVDPVTFEGWQTNWVDPADGTIYNPDHIFGNGNCSGCCRNRPEAYFSFHTNVASELAGMENMLTNAVPDGHHILVYTWRHLDKFGTNINSPSLIPALAGLGVTSLNALPDSVPYAFYVRKGFPETFRDTAGVAITDVLNFSVWVPTAFADGVITTMDAGPATSWDALFWDERPSDALDSTRIKLYGVPPGSNVGVLLLDLESPLDSFPDLSTVANAQQYPTLRIQGRFHDANISDAKPAQLQRWQLLSSPVPECAIHPPLGLYNDLEGWAEGQDAAVAVAVQNISEFDMDSLLIGAWLIDRNNQRHPIHFKLNAPLPAGGWVIDTVHFNTLGFGGWNTLLFEANPIDSTTGRYHQLEQYHFNNIAQWRFEVDQDLENPILDVTFDGRHILDGDIVSARPEILISLDDENILRILDSPGDTARFSVFLKRPNATDPERIWFRNGLGEEILQFIPASGPDNIACIHYRPDFSADGKYQMIVRGSDLSNNISGDNDYRIGFEVINRSTITEILNYPNPFTTSTRFVFTLTGSEIPTYMKVQIMTVTGKVVREIPMHELGPIRVGKNITEFAWDGTDEFGDRLARGVYLYRVFAKINGEEIETRESGASQYFTKGFGKMYLLR